MHYNRLNHDSLPKVYILLLNWNGWQDTLECLESVFRLYYPHYRVIVCDNGSTDDSLWHIQQWAKGQLSVWRPTHNALRSYSYPPIDKPITYCEYTRAEVESALSADEDDAKLIFIQTGENRGFAAGNNIGLRYALAKGDFDYIWLLNSDTVVAPDALLHLVEHALQDTTIGLCGSTLLYYHNPTLIQTLGGGHYNKWFALTSHLAENQPIEQFACEHRQQCSASMDYVMGASMLVSKAFLETVGLMSEEYFLYFEELDWAMRAHGRFKLGYAEKSVVYHKSGQSVGNTPRKWSALSVFYSTCSRIKFVRKFYPQFLPLLYLRLTLSFFHQCLKGQRAQAQAIWDAMRQHP
ncbi:MAG: glycosyltransferase family 2 protein [Candidatus Thermochlorobacter sp.]